MNGCGKTHEASSLILRGVPPSIALLSSPRAVGVGARLGTATTLQLTISDRRVEAIPSVFSRAARFVGFASKSARFP
jgi:hypothetical protein